MKKFLFSGAIALALILTGCSKNSETPVLDTVKKDVVSKIMALSFSTGQTSTSGAPQMLQRAKSVNTSFPFSVPVQQTVKDATGNGSLTLSGTISGTINDDYSIATENFTFDEIFANYSVDSESKTYTCSGTIKYVGDFAFVNPSSFTYTSSVKGSIVIKGTNYNQTAIIDITCKSSGSTSGSGYTVTGTINGENVSYSYN